MLGILIPTQGEVLIGGVKPSRAIAKWPGAISYVPQNSYISDTTIAENISFGYEDVTGYQFHLESAIRQAHLLEFVNSLPNKSYSPVGEDGKWLSGGQRQRIGIARALFTNPSLIVFDEATSALDGESESAISTSIAELKGQKTIIIVAHRLSAVKNADRIAYVEEGGIKAIGTFDEVRSKISRFDQQAKLMGL
jgi:ABC-type bacteriocin/lantibiotic exporter with double-glycine peptidase domain